MFGQRRSVIIDKHTENKPSPILAIEPKIADTKAGTLKGLSCFSTTACLSRIRSKAVTSPLAMVLVPGYFKVMSLEFGITTDILEASSRNNKEPENFFE